MAAIKRKKYYHHTNTATMTMAILPDAAMQDGLMHCAHGKASSIISQISSSASCCILSFSFARMHNVTTNRQLAICHGGYTCEKSEENEFAIALATKRVASLRSTEVTLHSIACLAPSNLLP